MRFLLLIALLAAANGNEFKTIHAWKELEYNFPNDTIRDTLISSGYYIPQNNVPLGVHVWNDRVFVTVPRFGSGVASNLNCFAKDDQSLSPKLNPYPNWETNDISTPNSNTIVSIFRVRSDACNRLWGVDTGINDMLGNATVVLPARIIVIDLETNKIIRAYPLKESDQTSDSFFAELVVDVEPDNCSNAYAYLSDLGSNALVVYSWAKNDSWRITHDFFHFDPLAGNFKISGYNFQWTDGIFGMSLSTQQNDSYKTLYFHPMSAFTEFSVSTEVLQDETLKKSSNYYAFNFVGRKGPNTQGPTSLIDTRTGIDYFAQINRNGIGCWDTSVELNPNTFVLADQDNTTLVFPNDLSIDPSTNTLYVLSNDLPQLLFSNYNTSTNNFFLTGASLDSLTPICQNVSNAPYTCS